MPSEDPNTEQRVEVPAYNGVGVTGGPGPSPYNDAAYAPQQQYRGDDYGAVPMPPPGGGGNLGLTEDAILSDLASAEQQAYDPVFNSFANGAPVPADSQPMRTFLMDNSSCDDIEISLLQSVNDDMQIDSVAFLELLRNNAIPETAILGQFTQLSPDGQALAAEECRTGLTMLGMAMNVNFTNERWDSILNMVMMDAGASVMMEDWMRYAKTVARFVRLFQFVGI